MIPIRLLPLERVVLSSLFGLAIFLFILLLSLRAFSQVDLINSSVKHIHIRHPLHEQEELLYARSTQYFVNLLKLAAKNSGYTLSREPVVLPSITGSRNARNLQSKLYDINWMHTNSEREQELLPIRIPLFRGLIGWRIFLVRREDSEKFAGIKVVDDIRSLTAGIGHDWPDIAIYRHNKYKIFSSSGRQSLVSMLKGRRIDYFPRAIPEAWKEIDLLNAHDIVVEDTLALRYHSAYYFFVTKENRELAELIEKGLQIAIDDGSFEKMFFEYYDDYLARTKLENRKVFNMANPHFRDVANPEDAKLWFEIEDYIRYKRTKAGIKY